MNDKPDPNRVARQTVWKLIPPFNCADATGHQIIVKTHLVQFQLLIKTIEVHVKKRKSAPSILVHNRKGWTGDFVFEPKPDRKSLYELCLSGSEIANQAQDRACRQAKFRSDQSGLVGACRLATSHWGYLHRAKWS